jgi:hypothetical protein
MSEKCVLMSRGKSEVEITWKTRTQMVNKTTLPVKAVVSERVFCIRVAQGRTQW